MKMVVSIEEFRKIDIRIGKVISVEEIPGSEKLYKLTVDFGSEKRQAVSGLKGYYTADDLLNKKFAFVFNLEHKKFMGVESECMILAAEDGDKIALLVPDKDVSVGSKVV